MLCSDVSPIHSLNLLYCTLLKKPTNKSMHLVYFLNLTNQRKTKAEVRIWQARRRRQSRDDFFRQVLPLQAILQGGGGEREKTIKGGEEE